MIKRRLKYLGVFRIALGKREERMPQKILCTGCNTVLYDGFELESPLEILQRNNGVCPKCGRRLGFNPDTIKIVPMSEIKVQRQ
jgi:hypothetical protein